MVKNLVEFILRKKSKLLIIPFYKDLEKIKHWKKILNYLDYVIYEKDENLSMNQKIKVTDNHYKIPSIGLGSFQFLYYIVNNYNNLPDTIVYTKSHWIPRFSNSENFIEDFNLDNILYYQHKTFRIWITDFFYKLKSKIHYVLPELYDEWKKCLTDFFIKNDKNFLKKYELKFDRKIKFVEIIKKKNYKFDDETIFDKKLKKLSKQTTIQTDPRFIAPSIEIIRQVFEDYDPKMDFNAYYNECSFTISKKVISYHSLEIWKKILNVYIKLFEENIYDINRQSEILVLDLFLKELTRRYIEKI
mgnify:CR=1 FL=1|tara:strand:+ start:635 stop:1540 length:906 start_codon:yes stop_codon:yes gene_type:complete